MNFFKRHQYLRTTLALVFFALVTISCSKNINYTTQHIKETSGRYLYNQEELIEVFYKDNNLFLKWKGAEQIKPVALDENTFFVADMYQKLQFVKHPETQKRYLSIIPENGDDTSITYDYLKVSDTFRTPSMYLKDKVYDKALEGYLAIQKQDSTSTFIDERAFNSLGYSHLRKQEHKDAIAIFKMNVALHPESDNVYDSLAEAYLQAGDSLQAYTNYEKALQLNSGNKRAKKFVETYKANN